MEKMIATSLSAFSCYFSIAQPAIDFNRFSIQIKELINYSENNFRDLPGDYKFEGAIESGTGKNSNNTLYQIILANKISEESSKKKFDEVREQIMLILGQKYFIVDETASGETKFIETCLCDSNYSVIKLSRMPNDNKSVVSLEISRNQKNNARLLIDFFDSSTQRNSDIIRRAKKIVVDKLGVAEYEVTFEASFTNDLGADSLDTVELVMEFEKEYNLSIPDEDAECIRTFGDAIEYLIVHIK